MAISAETCYALLKKVPKGRVTTYKSLANAMGSNAYRAIGRYMHNNPYAPVVPCHRVVGSDGSMTGFAGGLPKKIKMLADEGVFVKDNKVLDFNKVYYDVGASSRR